MGISSDRGGVQPMASKPLCVRILDTRPLEALTLLFHAYRPHKLSFHGWVPVVGGNLLEA
jgi:hypothetical protein